jgi:diguanylate cyclase (GGDEF)-like protein
MRALHVLLVEDSLADAELVTMMLVGADAAARIEHCTTLEAALGRLTDGVFDVVIADLSLPDAFGLEAVTGLRCAQPELPLIVLTGRDDDATALQALAAGAQDYVPKSSLTGPLLLRSLRYARERSEAESALRRSARWSAALLDGLEAPTCAIDQARRVVTVNAAMRTGSDLPLVGLPGHRLSRRGEDGTAAPVELLAGVDDVLDGRLPRFELECEGRNGRWWSVRATPLPADAGAVVTQVDVTELKRAQQQLSVASLHDSMTGLPNRTLLRDRLEQAFGYAARTQCRVAVALLDLDRFKLVNDTHGHASGDAVLVAVAERLTGACRPSDTVARVSGDEFVVAWIVDERHQPEVFAQRLVTAVALAGAVEGPSVGVTASLGLAVSGPGESVDDVLWAADEAMAVAKARGGAQVQCASAQMREELHRRLETEALLASALADGRVEVHYQPVVDLTTGVATGVEALARLRLPDGGLLMPAGFIDAAERGGLVVPLGSAVLDAACREAASWTGPHAALTVAVNLSTRQLVQPDVVATVQGCLARSGLLPSRLVLEVTESAVVEDAELALRALQALRGLGVRTAIDDFGTGYSSFLYLKQFPVDILKIDRSFVSGMLESPDDAAIVASIVRLGHDVGLTLIAEGVETEEQRQHLVELGCGEAQGYLFSRPVPGPGLPAALVPTAPAPGAPPATPRQRRSRSRGTAPLQGPVLQRLEQLSQQGASLHTVAAVLNTEGVPCPTGRRWHSRVVARYLEDQLVGAR